MGSHVEEESVVSLNAQSAKGLRRASSPASRRLRHRQKRWQRRVVAHLIRSHVARSRLDQDGGGCLPSRSCPIWECGSWLVGCYNSSGWLYYEAWSGSCRGSLGDRPRPKFSVFE